MGFVKGKRVTVIKSAPLQDPVEYKILGYHVSLRHSEARLIEIDEAADDLNPLVNSNQQLAFRELFQQGSTGISDGGKEKVIDVALVGNPNCGKTTLFNVASGSHERVGNFSGVTVESKNATFKKSGYTFNITDLPGTYSLTAYSPEELFVRQHIFEKVPDVVVNVIDGSNLERNLFLTTQLIDMDIRVIIALNMFDEFEDSGHQLDMDALGQLLGIPVVPTIGSKGIGIQALFGRIIDVYEDRDPVVRHVHINYGSDLEKTIHKIQDVLWKDQGLTDRISSRYLSIKLLEKDEEIQNAIRSSTQCETVVSIVRNEIHHLESNFREDVATLVADAKYGFIAGALKETMTPSKEKQPDKTTSERIDHFLTHRFFGFPIFLFFLWLMFQATFTLGDYPKSWIEGGVSWIGEQTTTLLPGGPVRDLLVDGIINGVGSVVVFLPNILILFFFISIMEDTGYMARAAFIMDKLMHKIGLHGQSFIPLIMGFGCNVPAIMATRTLKDRNDRLLTMLINPFMSCSARLPVYILIAGIIFPNYAGSIIFGLYLTGILIAVLVSVVLKKTLFKNKGAPFVLELPPYRMPTLRVSLRHMWEKGGQYLQKMGGIILIAVILIWALEYFPAGGKVSRDERLKQSYIGKIGRSIEPVIAPLGFDWRMGISLITGAAAKEVVVSTMGVLYGTNRYDEKNGVRNLNTELKEATYQDGIKKGQKIFTPLTGISYLLFILIYMPCVAVVAVVTRESGSWKWALFLITYTTALAWIISFTVYQVGSLLLI